jgi:hypothetical protein
MNSFAVSTYNKTKPQFAKENLTLTAISYIVSCCSNLIKFLIYFPFVFNGPIKSLTTDRLLAFLIHYSSMFLQISVPNFVNSVIVVIVKQINAIVTAGSET